MDPPLLLTYNDYIFIGYIYNLTLALSPHPNCIGVFILGRRKRVVYMLYTHLYGRNRWQVCTLADRFIFFTSWSQACRGLFGRSHALADRFVIFGLGTMTGGCLFLATRIICWRRIILREKGRACKTLNVAN